MSKSLKINTKKKICFSHRPSFGLLLAKGDGGVHSRCAPCRDRGRGQRDQRQQRRGRSEVRRVERIHAEEQRGQTARQCRRAKHSGGNPRHCDLHTASRAPGRARRRSARRAPCGCRIPACAGSPRRPARRRCRPRRAIARARRIRRPAARGIWAAPRIRRRSRPWCECRSPRAACQIWRPRALTAAVRASGSPAVRTAIEAPYHGFCVMGT